MIKSKIEFDKPSTMKMSDFIEVIQRQLIERNIVISQIYVDGNKIPSQGIVKGGDPNTSTYPYKNFENFMNHFFGDLRYLIDNLFQKNTESSTNLYELVETKPSEEKPDHLFDESTPHKENTDNELFIDKYVNTNPMELSDEENKNKKSILTIELDPMDLSKHYNPEKEEKLSITEDSLFKTHPIDVSQTHTNSQLSNAIESVEMNKTPNPSVESKSDHVILEVEYKTKCLSIDEYYKEREMREARMNEFADTKREYHIIGCYLGIDDKEKIEESMKYTKEWYRLNRKN